MTYDTTHQITDLVSGALLLMVTDATAVTIPQTDTATEILPMIDTHHVTPPTDLQGMKETGTTEGIPTLVLDQQSTMHVATAHHLKTTHAVAALLNAVRTDVPLFALLKTMRKDVPLIALQVLDM